MNEQELLELMLPPPRRRSSSLRRADSPGSPTDHRKKSVHFADALGLELRSVKHIVDKNSVPVVPATALRDMRRGMEEAHRMEGTRYVCACFTQPGDASDFLQRVNSNAVVLERYAQDCSIFCCMLCLTKTGFPIQLQTSSTNLTQY